MISITPRITITLYKGHLPIAWGHLDPDKGKTWLGVSVAHGYTTKGNGNKIVKRLCRYADNAGWDLWLSCHKTWLRDWYKEFGFRVVKNDGYYLMKRKKKRAGKT